MALNCGVSVSAPLPKSEGVVGDEVTVMIRPEHARLATAASGDSQIVSGPLEDIIYFGTDTYFNIKLADGTLFTVRQQNRPGEEGSYAKGDAVGASFPASAIRVLRG